MLILLLFNIEKRQNACVSPKKAVPLRTILHSIPFYRLIAMHFRVQIRCKPTAKMSL